MSEQLFRPVTKEMISLSAKEKSRKATFSGEAPEKIPSVFSFSITAILATCNFGCQKELIDGAKSCLKKTAEKML